MGALGTHVSSMHYENLWKNAAIQHRLCFSDSDPLGMKVWASWPGEEPPRAKVLAEGTGNRRGWREELYPARPVREVHEAFALSCVCLPVSFLLSVHYSVMQSAHYRISSGNCDRVGNGMKVSRGRLWLIGQAWGGIESLADCVDGAMDTRPCCPSCLEVAELAKAQTASCVGGSASPLRSLQHCLEPHFPASPSPWLGERQPCAIREVGLCG